MNDKYLKIALDGKPVTAIRNYAIDNNCSLKSARIAIEKMISNHIENENKEKLNERI